MMRIPMLACLSALILAGAAMADESRPGQSWQVISAAGTDFAPEDEVTIEFVEGLIAGRSGCNRYTGGAQLVAQTPLYGTLTLGAVAGTRMACMGRAGEIEPVFLGALGHVDAWRIEADGTLSLLAGDEVAIRARVAEAAAN